MLGKSYFIETASKVISLQLLYDVHSVKKSLDARKQNHFDNYNDLKMKLSR